MPKCALPARPPLFSRGIDLRFHSSHFGALGLPPQDWELDREEAAERANADWYEAKRAYYCGKVGRERQCIFLMALI